MIAILAKLVETHPMACLFMGFLSICIIMWSIETAVVQLALAYSARYNGVKDQKPE